MANGFDKVGGFVSTLGSFLTNQGLSADGAELQEKKKLPGLEKCDGKETPQEVVAYVFNHFQQPKIQKKVEDYFHSIDPDLKLPKQESLKGRSGLKRVVQVALRRGKDIQDQDPLRAKKLYQAVLEIDPENSEAHKLYGGSLLASGDRKGAQSEFKKAAQFEIRPQGLRELVECYRKTLEAGEENIDPWDELGIYLTKNKHYSQASQLYALAAEDAKSKGEHLSSGQYMAKRHYAEQAGKPYEVTLSPDKTPVVDRLYWFLRLEGVTLPEMADQIIPGEASGPDRSVEALEVIEFSYQHRQDPRVQAALKRFIKFEAGEEHLRLVAAKYLKSYAVRIDGAGATKASPEAEPYLKWALQLTSEHIKAQGPSYDALQEKREIYKALGWVPQFHTVFNGHEDLVRQEFDKRFAKFKMGAQEEVKGERKALLAELKNLEDLATTLLNLHPEDPKIKFQNYLTLQEFYQFAGDYHRGKDWGRNNDASNRYNQDKWAIEGFLKEQRNVLFNSIDWKKATPPSPNQLKSIQTVCWMDVKLGNFETLDKTLVLWVQMTEALPAGKKSDSTKVDQYGEILKYYFLLRERASGKVPLPNKDSVLSLEVSQIDTKMKAVADKILNSALYLEGFEYQQGKKLNKVKEKLSDRLEQFLKNQDSQLLKFLSADGLKDYLIKFDQAEDLLVKGLWVDSLSAGAGPDAQEKVVAKKVNLFLKSMALFSALGNDKKVKEVIEAIGAETYSSEESHLLRDFALKLQIYQNLKGSGLPQEKAIRKECQDYTRMAEARGILGTGYTQSIKALTLARIFYGLENNSDALTKIEKRLETDQERFRSNLDPKNDDLVFLDKSENRLEVARVVNQIDAELLNTHLNDKNKKNLLGKNIQDNLALWHREIENAADLPFEKRLAEAKFFAQVVSKYQPLWVEGILDYDQREAINQMAFSHFDTLIKEKMKMPSGLEGDGKKVWLAAKKDLELRIQQAVHRGDSVYLQKIDTDFLESEFNKIQSAHALWQDVQGMPKSKNKFHKTLQTMVLFSEFGLNERTEEASKVMFQYIDGLSDPAEKVQLILAVGEIFEKSGNASLHKVALQKIVALDPGTGPKTPQNLKLHEIAQLSRGLIHIYDGKKEEAQKVFSTIPQNPIAAAYLGHINNQSKQRRIIFTIQIAKGISANFIQRGRSHDVNMDAIEKDTMAAWDAIQGLLLSGKISTVKEGIQWVRDNPDRFPKFMTGFTYQGRAKAVHYGGKIDTSEYHVADAAWTFISFADNPAVSDYEFDNQALKAAERLVADDYFSSASNIFQLYVNHPNKRFSDWAKGSLGSMSTRAKISGATSFIPFTSGTLGADFLEGNLYRASSIIVPFGIARGLALGAEGLFLSRVGAEVVQSSLLYRAMGFTIRTGSEAFGFTVSGMMLQTAFTGSTEQWTWGNFFTQMASMGITFTALHGVGMGTSWLGGRAKGIAWAEKTLAITQRPINIMAFTGTSYLNSWIGLHPQEKGVSFYAVLFESAVMDAQMSLAHKGLDKVSGGWMTRKDMAHKLAYEAKAYIPSLKKLGFNTDFYGKPSKPGLMPTAGETALRILMSRVAKGENKGEVLSSFSHIKEGELPKVLKNSFGIKASSPEGQEMLALIFLYAHGRGYGESGRNFNAKDLILDLKKIDGAVDKLIKESGVSGKEKTDAKKFLRLWALRQGVSPESLLLYSTYGKEILQGSKVLLELMGTGKGDSNILEANLLFNVLFSAKNPKEAIEQLKKFGKHAPESRAYLIKIADQVVGPNQGKKGHVSLEGKALMRELLLDYLNSGKSLENLPEFLKQAHQISSEAKGSWSNIKVLRDVMGNKNYGAIRSQIFMKALKSAENSQEATRQIKNFGKNSKALSKALKNLSENPFFIIEGKRAPNAKVQSEQYASIFLEAALISNPNLDTLPKFLAEASALARNMHEDYPKTHRFFSEMEAGKGESFKLKARLFIKILNETGNSFAAKDRWQTLEGQISQIDKKLTNELDRRLGKEKYLVGKELTERKLLKAEIFVEALENTNSPSEIPAWIQKQIEYKFGKEPTLPENLEDYLSKTLKLDTKTKKGAEELEKYAALMVHPEKRSQLKSKHIELYRMALEGDQAVVKVLNESGFSKGKSFERMRSKLLKEFLLEGWTPVEIAELAELVPKQKKLIESTVDSLGPQDGKSFHKTKQGRALTENLLMEIMKGVNSPDQFAASAMNWESSSRFMNNSMDSLMQLNGLSGSEAKWGLLVWAMREGKTSKDFPMILDRTLKGELALSYSEGKISFKDVPNSGKEAQRKLVLERIPDLSEEIVAELNPDSLNAETTEIAKKGYVDKILQTMGLKTDHPQYASYADQLGKHLDSLIQGEIQLESGNWMSEAKDLVKSMEEGRKITIVLDWNKKTRLVLDPKEFRSKKDSHKTRKTNVAAKSKPSARDTAAAKEKIPPPMLQRADNILKETMEKSDPHFKEVREALALDFQAKGKGWEAYASDLQTQIQRGESFQIQLADGKTFTLTKRGGTSPQVPGHQKGGDTAVLKNKEGDTRVGTPSGRKRKGNSGASQEVTRPLAARSKPKIRESLPPKASSVPAYLYRGLDLNWVKDADGVLDHGNRLVSVPFSKKFNHSINLGEGKGTLWLKWDGKSGYQIAYNGTEVVRVRKTSGEIVELKPTGSKKLQFQELAIGDTIVAGETIFTFKNKSRIIGEERLEDGIKNNSKILDRMNADLAKLKKPGWEKDSDQSKKVREQEEKIAKIEAKSFKDSAIKISSDVATSVLDGRYFVDGKKRNLFDKAGRVRPEARLELKAEILKFIKAHDLKLSTDPEKAVDSIIDLSLSAKRHGVVDRPGGLSRAQFFEIVSHLYTHQNSSLRIGEAELTHVPMVVEGTLRHYTYEKTRKGERVTGEEAKVVFITALLHDAGKFLGGDLKTTGGFTVKADSFLNHTGLDIVIKPGENLAEAVDRLSKDPDFLKNLVAKQDKVSTSEEAATFLKNLPLLKGPSFLVGIIAHHDSMAVHQYITGDLVKNGIFTKKEAQKAWHAIERHALVSSWIDNNSVSGLGILTKIFQDPAYQRFLELYITGAEIKYRDGTEIKVVKMDGLGQRMLKGEDIFNSKDPATQSAIREFRNIFNNDALFSPLDRAMLLGDHQGQVDIAKYMGILVNVPPNAKATVKDLFFGDSRTNSVEGVLKTHRDEQRLFSKNAGDRSSQSFDVAREWLSQTDPSKDLPGLAKTILADPALRLKYDNYLKDHPNSSFLDWLGSMRIKGDDGKPTDAFKSIQTVVEKGFYDFATVQKTQERFHWDRLSGKEVQGLKDEIGFLLKGDSPFLAIAKKYHQELKKYNPTDVRYGDTLAKYRAERDQIAKNLINSHEPAMKEVLRFLTGLPADVDFWEPLEKRGFQRPQLVRSVPPHGRLKNPTDLVPKMQRRGLESFNPINDLAGVRMVVEGPTDVIGLIGAIQKKYPLAESYDAKGNIQLDVSHVETGADGEKILVLDSIPKRDSLKRIIEGSKTGYRAVHLTVLVDGKPVEIQIQTHGIYRWGQIQHSYYKNSHNLPKDILKDVDQFFKESADFIALSEQGRPPNDIPKVPDISAKVPQPQRSQMQKDVDAMSALLLEGHRSNFEKSLNEKKYPKNVHEWVQKFYSVDYLGNRPLVPDLTPIMAMIDRIGPKKVEKILAAGGVSRDNFATLLEMGISSIEVKRGKAIQNFIEKATVEEILFLTQANNIDFLRTSKLNFGSKDKPVYFFESLISDHPYRNLDSVFNIAHPETKQLVLGLMALREFNRPQHSAEGVEFLNLFGIDPARHDHFPWNRKDLKARTRLYEEIHRVENRLRADLKKAFPKVKPEQLESFLSDLWSTLRTQDVQDTHLPYTPHGWLHSFTVMQDSAHIYQSSGPLQKSIVAKLRPIHGDRAEAVALELVKFIGIFHDVGYGCLHAHESKGLHAERSGEVFKEKFTKHMEQVFGIKASDPLFNEVFLAIERHGADKPHKVDEYMTASDVENPFLFVVRLADNLDLTNRRMRQIQLNQPLMTAFREMYEFGEKPDFQKMNKEEQKASIQKIRAKHIALWEKSVRDGQMTETDFNKAKEVLNNQNESTYPHFAGTEKVTGYRLIEHANGQLEVQITMDGYVYGKNVEEAGLLVEHPLYQVLRTYIAARSMTYGKDSSGKPLPIIFSYRESFRALDPSSGHELPIKPDNIIPFKPKNKTPLPKTEPSQDLPLAAKPKDRTSATRPSHLGEGEYQVVSGEGKGRMIGFIFKTDPKIKSPQGSDNWRRNWEVVEIQGEKIQLRSPDQKNSVTLTLNSTEGLTKGDRVDLVPQIAGGQDKQPLVIPILDIPQGQTQLTIGKGQDANVKLRNTHPDFQDVHFQLVLKGDGWYLQPLKEAGRDAPGFYHNGHWETGPVRIKKGDEISLRDRKGPQEVPIMVIGDLPKDRLGRMGQDVPVRVEPPRPALKTVEAQSSSDKTVPHFDVDLLRGDMDLRALKKAGLPIPVKNIAADENLGNFSIVTTQGEGYGKSNEDLIFVMRGPDGSAYAVAIDGMGGTGNGQMAAQLVALGITAEMKRSGNWDQSWQLANRAVGIFNKELSAGAIDKAAFDAANNFINDPRLGEGMAGAPGSGAVAVGIKISAGKNGSVSNVDFQWVGDARAKILRRDENGQWQAVYSTVDEGFASHPDFLRPGRDYANGGGGRTLAGAISPFAKWVENAFGQNLDLKIKKTSDGEVPDFQGKSPTGAIKAGKAFDSGILLRKGDMIVWGSDGFWEVFGSTREVLNLIQNAKNEADAVPILTQEAHRRMGLLSHARKWFRSPQGKGHERMPFTYEGKLYLHIRDGNQFEVKKYEGNTLFIDSRGLIYLSETDGMPVNKFKMDNFSLGAYHHVPKVVQEQRIQVAAKPKAKESASPEHTRKFSPGLHELEKGNISLNYMIPSEGKVLELRIGKPPQGFSPKNPALFIWDNLAFKGGGEKVAGTLRQEKGVWILTPQTPIQINGTVYHPKDGPVVLTDQARLSLGLAEFVYAKETGEIKPDIIDDYYGTHVHFYQPQ